MPDPLTNLEIQDVLSSIRRLVSEDNRHRAERERAREAGGGMPASVPAEAGKLVLTEALRVPLAELAGPEEAGAADPVPGATDLAGPETASLTDPAGAGSPPDDVRPASDVPAEDVDGEVLDLAITGEGRFEAGNGVAAVAESESAGDDTWETADDVRDADAGSLEDTIAELEAAVAGIGGEFEPDGSEVAHGREIDAELEEAFEDGFAVDLAVGEEADALAQSVTSGAIGASVGTGAIGEAAVAAAAEPVSEDREEDAESGRAPETIDEDAAAGAIAAGAEPEAAAPVDHFDLATPEVPEAPMADMPEEAGPTFIRSAAPWRGAAPAVTPELARPAGLRRLTLTAADAVPEAPARCDCGDAEPAEPEPSTMPDDAPDLASAPAWDSAVRAEGEGESEAEGSIFGPGDDGLVDMNMLRDLVAEIIREELQGPLGERITRNVRILVRREINRALESRGLE